MRQLLILTTAGMLSAAIAGCAGTPDPGAQQNTPPPADTGGAPQSTQAAPPAAERPLGTALTPRRGDATLEDRRSKDEAGGQRARTIVPEAGKVGGTPGIPEVQDYLKRLLYPGSRLMNDKEPSNNGSVVIAMTRAEALPGQVRDHFVQRGAKIIDERVEQGAAVITLQLTDNAAGVRTTIAINQTSATDTGCMVNYSVHGIARSSASDDAPASGDGPAMPGQVAPDAPADNGINRR